MKGNEFIKTFTVLMEIYNTNFSEATINIYYEILKDVPVKDFEISVKKILTERVFTTFPKPAEFLQIIYGKKEEQEELIVSEAVSKFRLCLKKGGAIKTDDRKLVWAISRMGGWEYVRKIDINKIDFAVIEFKKIYSEMLKREVPEEIGFELLSTQAILSKENGTFFPILTVSSESKKELITT